tara:strand:- start:1045 stop:1572 length:528 start_codon:yes stop_codon:yes gene_type:complete
MLIHYFNKKENKDKLEANRIYQLLIKNLRIIANNKELSIKKDFNTSFELMSIILFVIFFNYNKKIENKKICQNLINLYISDLDISLREIGIGDISIGKYVKSYVKKLYYRISKYEKIFINNNYDEFEKFIKKINIQINNNSEAYLSKYLFIFIKNLLKKAEKEDIREFKIIKFDN